MGQNVVVSSASFASPAIGFRLYTLQLNTKTHRNPNQLWGFWYRLRKEHKLVTTEALLLTSISAKLGLTRSA